MKFNLSFIYLIECVNLFKNKDLKGWMYILKCCDGTYYTGSTKNLEERINSHKNGTGANYTKKRLPVELVYVEEHDTISAAFEREKKIQNWSRMKKEALIKGGKINLKTATKKSNFRRKR